MDPVMLGGHGGPFVAWMAEIVWIPPGLWLQHQWLPVQTCAQSTAQAEGCAEEDDPAPERTLVTCFPHRLCKMSQNRQYTLRKPWFLPGVCMFLPGSHVF